MADRSRWSVWTQLFKQWGIQDLAATFLEQAGPLTILAAQFVFLLQPFWGSPSQNWLAFGEMLENRSDCLDFANLLREETQPCSEQNTSSD
jgi:hypothetical protein